MIKVLKKTIHAIFSFAYKIINFFHLQFTLLVLLIGLVLYLTGLLERNLSLKIIYVVVLLFSVLSAVFLTIKKLFGVKKEKQEKNVQIIKQETATKNENETLLNEQPVSKETNSAYPKYYNVKQNGNYLMAEYEDRYELYLKTTQGLQKVRTDYK